MVKHNSFIDRKRPAVEGLVEDLLGPSGQLDKLISGNPLPTDAQTETENQVDSHSKTENKPG